MATPLKILLVEDSEDDADLLVCVLRQAGFAPHWKRVETEQEFLTGIRDSPDIILCDHSLPRFNGLRAAKILQESGLDIPFMLISGTVGEEIAVEAMKHGATDYLLKDRLARLGSAVQRALEEQQLRRQRRQAQEELREQAALLDAANDAIYVHDLAQTVLYWNRGAERLYGHTSEEAVGRKTAEVVPSDPDATTAAHAVLLEQDSWSGELRQTTKAGKTLIVFSRWTLLRDAQGQPIKVLTINADLSEKKQMEAQFLRAHRLEAIGALASGIAHDLNNILSPVLMIGPHLRERVQDPDTRKLLDTIHSCAQRGAAIVKQLLTFARGTPGTRVPLPVGYLLRDLEKIIRETFPRDIRSRTIAPADTWPLLGDATQVHQALMNLCVNARDAMPDGGTLTMEARNVTIGAGAAPGAKPGKYVCVSVADTGTGIAPEDLDRIFDPFFTTKEIGKGTGLGLASVLGIVRGHEGFVHVESKPGHGTTFALHFPASPQAMAAPDESPDEVAPRGRGELILVVDDEEALRDTLRCTLENHGYKVVTATQGADGLAVFGKHCGEVRAVLTDMMMPVMNGPTMINALRSLDPGLLVLGMSGLSERTGVKGFDQVKLAMLLEKPFAAGELLRVLHEALEAAPSGAH